MKMCNVRLHFDKSRRKRCEICQIYQILWLRYFNVFLCFRLLRARCFWFLRGFLASTLRIAITPCVHHDVEFPEASQSLTRYFCQDGQLYKELDEPSSSASCKSKNRNRNRWPLAQLFWTFELSLTRVTKVPPAKPGLLRYFFVFGPGGASIWTRQTTSGHSAILRSQVPRPRAQARAPRTEENQSIRLRILVTSCELL